MISISTNADAIKTPETVATRTSRVDSIMPHMRIGTLSIETMNARNAPAAIMDQGGEAEGDAGSTSGDRKRLSATRASFAQPPRCSARRVCRPR